MLKFKQKTQKLLSAILLKLSIYLSI